MIRTLAPLEIKLSTSVSCLVGEPCASAEIYLAPLGASAPLIAASSVFQRSSWKFDHETPTTMSLAIAATDITLVDASRAAPTIRVLTDFIRFPPLAVLPDQFEIFNRAFEGRDRYSR